MTTIADLLPLNVTSISGVTINSTQANYLAGSSSTNVIAGKCLVAETGRNIGTLGDPLGNIRSGGNITCNGYLIPGGIQMTNNSTMWAPSGGPFYITSPTVITPIINTSIQGSAVRTAAQGLNASDTIIPTTNCVKSYVDTAVATFNARSGESGTINTTSGSTVTLTGIPTTANYVDIVIHTISATVQSNLGIRLGTTGGLISSGYFGRVRITTASDIEWSDRAYISIGTNEGSSGVTGIIHLTKFDPGNTWLIEGQHIGTGSGDPAEYSGGVAIGGNLYQIQLLTSAGTFNQGYIKYRWRI